MMKLSFSKKEKQARKLTEKKVKVMTVGTHKKSVIVLWILLIGSLTFGIYKNFTAIDQHTVHETEIIETKVIDTSAIESFTKSFVKDYYTWRNEKVFIERRAEKINDYLTEELKVLNVDTVRADIPTSSSVEDVNIWSVSQENEDIYAVVYSLDQSITEGENSKWIRSAYRILLHQDDAGNLVIIQNPTLWSLPKKSAYEAEQSESIGTVDSDTAQEVTEFLETFFTFYPTATDKELAYYVKNNALPSIGMDYLFSEIINPVFQQYGHQIQVRLTVKYLDDTTKATHFSQYILTLEKGTNWMIVNHLF